MLLHALHGLVEVLLGERLAADDVAEEPADGVDARAQQTARRRLLLRARGLVSLRRGEDIVYLVAEILEDELALSRRSPCRCVDLFYRRRSRRCFGLGVGAAGGLR
jgi:hypothetical protein